MATWAPEVRAAVLAPGEALELDHALI
jgi:hypothetical protein